MLSMEKDVRERESKAGMWMGRDGGGRSTHLLLFCMLSSAWHDVAGCHLLCAAIEKKFLVVLNFSGCCLLLVKYAGNSAGREMHVAIIF